MFVDRATKPTLAENMKEAIAMEEHTLALEKKNVVDERMSKKVAFRDDPKKNNQRTHSTWNGYRKF